MSQKKNTSLRRIEKENFHLSPEHPIYIHCGRFPAEAENRFEMHYALEMGILLSGRARRYYVNYAFDVEPGDVWFCGIWEPHSRLTLAGPCERIFISILPQALAHLRLYHASKINFMDPFMADPARRPRLNARRRKEVIQLGRRLLAVRQTGGEQEQMWRLLLLLEILLTVMRDWHCPMGEKEWSTSDHFIRLNRAIELVFDSRRRISDNEAARLCRMSTASFCRIFRELMGISVSKFALRYRINEAASELLNTPAQIKKIARNWGFADASHFNRCFQEHYGCSPKNYRQQFSLPPS